MTFPLIQTLQEYGLSKKEASLYAFIFSRGETSLEQIGEKFSMPRQEAIHIINKMIQNGYVTKSDMHTYTATDLVTLIASTKEICRDFSQILPCFYDIMQKYNNMPKTYYYEGISGLKKYYNQQLMTDHDIFAFLGTQTLHPDLTTYLYEEYVPKRVAKGIYAKVILSNGDDNQRYVDKNQEGLRQTVIIDNPLLVINSEINLFGENKVGFAMFSKHEMSAIIIQSKQLYTTFKSIFDLLWASQEGVD